MSVALLPIAVLSLPMFLGAASGGAPARSAAQFEGKDTLLRPEGYREWVFVGSSLGLRYDDGAKRPEQRQFNNVYIDPTAYRAYRKTGTFPQGTVLVLETAAGEEKKEPGLRGSFQKEFNGLAAAVKDTDRFPDGWSYFSFSDGPGKTKTKAQPAKKAACFDCHQQKAAEDHVFTQFYPVLKAARAHAQLDLGGVIEKHVMIPMRDGTKLSAYLYFPAGDGPWPVLLEQRYADLRGADTRKSFARLAAAGYVAAALNFRGTHLSEGAWVGYRALGWGEQKDGFDAVEWLARQPWSTGKVGTLGSSQAGFAQNFLAVTQPPHLVCQYMIDTGLSLFHEGYRIGGTTRPQRFKQMEAVCRAPADNRRLLREWFAHPTYDAYWADEDCTRHFDKMNVPCFTIGSWYDFMCVGSIDSYVGRQHRGGPGSRGKQQLLLGPWLHGRNKEVNKVGDLTYPENARFAMEAHMIRWFDHYLKGKDNGVEREPAVRYYVMGAIGEKDAPGNVWRTAADWPVAAQSVAYYLHAGGGLSLQPPTDATGATAFDADPNHPNEIKGVAFPGARDARPFEEQKNVRTFTSAVLTEPVEWTGKVQAELYVTSTTPDGDFIVRVSDVYPDGRSILLMDYVRRARYRDGYDKEVPMEPNKVTRVAFDIGSTSQIFNRGHRIRITVASTGAPFYEPNPNTGLPLTIDPPVKTQVAHNTVRHDRQHASRVLAPVRRIDQGG